MWRTDEGSTGRLIQLCIGYFIFYIVTGLSVKFFLSVGIGRPGMHGMEYLFYSTTSSTLLATSVVLFLKWYRMESVRRISLGNISFPSEFLYIIPSGICTAIIIPTTTLMYSFGAISVMVAMVIMRGAVIVIGRIVDAIQIRQGILHKKVYKEENIAIVFALLAISIKVFSSSGNGKANPFTSLPVMIIFGVYIIAYAIRIYIMNYYKNTRPKNAKFNNNKSFFAVEQITSTTTLYLIAIILLIIVKTTGWSGERITPFANSFFHPIEGWWFWAMIFGTAFGVVAFFSVFIFMFRGRTATFAGLVNRLTSLIAGTVSTLIFWLAIGGKKPVIVDWVSLIFILTAVSFIAVAEKKRSKELALNESR
jgi:hypothetical protein